MTSALFSYHYNTKMMELTLEAKLKISEQEESRCSTSQSLPIPSHTIFDPIPSLHAIEYGNFLFPSRPLLIATGTTPRSSSCVTFTEFSRFLTSFAPNFHPNFLCSPSPTLPSENTPGSTSSRRRGEALYPLEVFDLATVEPLPRMLENIIDLKNAKGGASGRS